jgi:hypothetical protein
VIEISVGAARVRIKGTPDPGTLRGASELAHRSGGHDVIAQGLPSVVDLAAGTRVWLAASVTDMRAGFNSLAARMQTVLDRDPYSGHVFVSTGSGRQIRLGEGTQRNSRSYMETIKLPPVNEQPDRVQGAFFGFSGLLRARSGCF